MEPKVPRIRRKLITTFIASVVKEKKKESDFSSKKNLTESHIYKSHFLIEYQVELESMHN